MKNMNVAADKELYKNQEEEDNVQVSQTKWKEAE